MVGNIPGIATTLGKCLQEVQPLAAAAEKVFSILINTFGQLQTPSLEDYISTSVMLQYNKRFFCTFFCTFCNERFFILRE